jgi:hypothetical protein
VYTKKCESYQSKKKEKSEKKREVISKGGCLKTPVEIAPL